MTAPLSEHEHAATLAALNAQVERCYRRSERAAARLAAAEAEVADATEAGRAACTAVLEFKRANPDPQLEMMI